MSGISSDAIAALAVELTKMKMQSIYSELGKAAFNTDVWVKHYHESFEQLRQSEKDYKRQKPRSD